MRLGLVSDTHDNLDLARVAARFLHEQACDLVLHLGDVTGPPMVSVFAGLPMRFLRGNNDDADELADALEANGFPALADNWTGTLAGVRVAAHHGHLRFPPVDVLRGAPEPDLLLHGHTHKRRCERVGRTLVVNPGALHRALTKSVAVVELPALEVRFHEVTPEGVRGLRDC